MKYRPALLRAIYHECGHDLLARLVGYDNISIEFAAGIRPNGTPYQASCRFTSYDTDTEQGRLVLVHVLLAGIAATTIRFRDSLLYALVTGGIQDWRDAKALLTGTNAEREKKLKHILTQVKAILRDHWIDLEARVAEQSNHAGQLTANIFRSEEILATEISSTCV